MPAGAGAKIAVLRANADQMLGQQLVNVNRMHWGAFVPAPGCPDRLPGRAALKTAAAAVAAHGVLLVVAPCREKPVLLPKQTHSEYSMRVPRRSKQPPACRRRVPVVC